jgi:hypothetical protein
MASDPITDDERDRILQLHDQGMSRNDIAREIGRSGSTVTKVVHDAGLTFDRAPTKAATEARKVDLAAKRASLRAKFLTRADELLDMFDKPVTVFNFGGRDNSYAERTLDRPTIGDMRSLVQAAATASTQEIRIAQADAGQGEEAARSLLGGLAAALGLTDPEEPADDDPAPA